MTTIALQERGRLMHLKQYALVCWQYCVFDWCASMPSSRRRRAGGSCIASRLLDARDNRPQHTVGEAAAGGQNGNELGDGRCSQEDRGHGCDFQHTDQAARQPPAGWELSMGRCIHDCQTHERLAKSSSTERPRAREVRCRECPADKHRRDLFLRVAQGGEWKKERGADNRRVDDQGSQPLFRCCRFSWFTMSSCGAAALRCGTA